MSWRDEWQPASFRGVGFHVKNLQAEYGRRIHVHQYPQRDIPYNQDMGRKNQTFTIDGFLMGDDLSTQQTRLNDAVEKSGPGRLVHPYHGTLYVECIGARATISNKQGGVVKYQLNFIEAGKNETPVASTTARNALSDAVGDGLKANDNSLEKKLKTKGPGYLLKNASKLVTSGADKLKALNNKQNWIYEFSTLSNSINSVSSEVETLIKTPVLLTSQVTGLIASVVGAGRSITGLARSTPRTLSNILESQRSLTSIAFELKNETTPSRVQENINSQAIADYFSIAATLSAADAIAEASKIVGVVSAEQSPFESYDQAISTRDNLLEDLDSIAAATTDDTLYEAIRSVQTQLQLHIDAHGLQLPNLQKLQLLANEPALTVAWRLYGSIDRADDIVKRNGVSHPLFVPASQQLEVLTNG